MIKLVGYKYKHGILTSLQIFLLLIESSLAKKKPYQQLCSSILIYHIAYYEWAKRTKFLKAVIYVSPRRHSNRKPLEEIGKSRNTVYDHFRTSWISLIDEPAQPNITWPGQTVTLIDSSILESIEDTDVKISILQPSFMSLIKAIKI